VFKTEEEKKEIKILKNINIENHSRVILDVQFYSILQFSQFSPNLEANSRLVVK
jgi:hypothetical protein